MISWDSPSRRTTAYVLSMVASYVPGFPNNGIDPNTSPNTMYVVWGILGGILVTLIIIFFLTRKK